MRLRSLPLSPALLISLVNTDRYSPGNMADFENIHDIRNTGLSHLGLTDDLVSRNGPRSQIFRISTSQKRLLHDFSRCLIGRRTRPDQNGFMEYFSVPPIRVFARHVKGRFHGGGPRLAGSVSGHNHAFLSSLSGLMEFQLPRLVGPGFPTIGLLHQLPEFPIGTKGIWVSERFIGVELSLGN